MFENHSQDSRYTGPLEVSQTILSTFGTGGNNQPFVVQTPKTLKIRCGCEGGGKGALIQDDLSATLGTNNDQTLFQPRAFGICAKNSNSMKSDNPNSGFYEADTSRTLDANGGNPTCNQGGVAVVAIEGNGSRPSHKGDGYKESDVMYTLNATEQHAVAFADVHATLSANDGPKSIQSDDEEPGRELCGRACIWNWKTCYEPGIQCKVQLSDRRGSRTDHCGSGSKWCGASKVLILKGILLYRGK